MPDSIPTKKEITQEYRGLVSAISHRMIKNPEAAKDAVQETWMEILKSLKTFKEESKISTWIYTIASRVILNDQPRSS
jgi:RNA polymerase sigma-70 factor (ECF subfamily)